LVDVKSEWERRREWTWKIFYKYKNWHRAGAGFILIPLDSHSFRHMIDLIQNFLRWELRIWEYKKKSMKNIEKREQINLLSSHIVLIDIHSGNMVAWKFIFFQLLPRLYKFLYFSPSKSKTWECRKGAFGSLNGFHLNQM
jgi:hypothetical protein